MVDDSKAFSDGYSTKYSLMIDISGKPNLQSSSFEISVSAISGYDIPSEYVFNPFKFIMDSVYVNILNLQMTEEEIKEENLNFS